MAEATPITAIDPSIGASSNALQSQATNAFGLGFEDLLKIVLTQLTYQDPLKPMESFEFVSQLAQFSQIQQTQTMSDNLSSILSAEAAAQATNLLGRTVDIPAGAGVISGRVDSISFSTGQPLVTITTDDNRTISAIALASISRIAKGD